MTRGSWEDKMLTVGQTTLLTMLESTIIDTPGKWQLRVVNKPSLDCSGATDCDVPDWMGGPGLCPST